jgi:hypothetical protein
MACTVKVSSTGIVEVWYGASIKQTSGTYHHHFHFQLLDKDEQTLWTSPIPTELHLTLGAKVDHLNQPENYSKSGYKKYDIDPDLAEKVKEVAFAMQQFESGGSLIDQIDELGKIYQRLKDNPIIKDLLAVVTVTDKEPPKESSGGGGGISDEPLKTVQPLD